MKKNLLLIWILTFLVEVKADSNDPRIEIPSTKDWPADSDPNVDPDADSEYEEPPTDEEDLDPPQDEEEEEDDESFFGALPAQQYRPIAQPQGPSKSEQDAISTAEENVIQEAETSANPGAANAVVGTGALGRFFGIKKESGVRLSGSYIGDGNYIFSGGLKPKSLTPISSFLLGLYFDTQQIGLWKGGLFGLSFLQVNAGPAALNAGSVQVFNSLGGIPPSDRSEFYEYWYRQELFNKKVVFRIGKMVTSAEFNNVVRERPLVDESKKIPGTTSLIYLPIFVTPTLIGTIPGYYNSAFGASLSYNPIESVYISGGVYDGNLARGRNTGLHSPLFNSYRFNVAEAGHGWFWGKNRMPGALSFGGWYQTGKFILKNIIQDGYGGFYYFGSQRLWYRNPGKDNSGIVAFIQGGWSNSEVKPMNLSAGGGLTFFSLVPYRPADSFGVGVSWANLNKNIFVRSSELMIQGYYRLFMFATTSTEFAFTSIPDPGASKTIPATWIGTARLIVLF